MENIDFLAIGDITTDAFIRLADATVTCNAEHEHCNLCVRFGDKIPYEFVEVVRAVGNSANAAVSAARLGLSSSLVANIGNDQNGKECVEALTANKVGTQFIQTDEKVPTNYHYVLWYEADRTILVKQNSFTYNLPEIGKPKWIYLSSIGAGTEAYHEKISEYVKNNPEINLAFQPGTFQMKLGPETLKDIYANTSIFFCNKEEAQRILNNEEHDLKTLMSGLHTLGPKMIVVTDGPNGAYVSDGNESWFMPPYPDPKAPFERTGAGDAFASTFTAAIALGKSIEDAMLWAPINSMAVVQEIGAQKGLLTQTQLQEWLAKAPENYKPQKI